MPIKHKINTIKKKLVPHETLVVIDVQPEYIKSIYWLHEFISFLNKEYKKFKNIVFLYNGSNTVGEMNEDDYRYWLMEEGMDEDVLDKIIFYDKGYAFFRFCMDQGQNHESIVNLVRMMREKNINDSLELDVDFWNEFIDRYGDEDIRNTLEHSDDMINIPDLMDFIDRYDNILLAGGAREECLKEVEIALEALGKKYKIHKHYIYKDGGQIGFDNLPEIELDIPTHICKKDYKISDLGQEINPETIILCKKGDKVKYNEDEKSFIVIEGVNPEMEFNLLEDEDDLKEYFQPIDKWKLANGGEIDDYSDSSFTSFESEKFRQRARELKKLGFKRWGSDFQIPGVYSLFWEQVNEMSDADWDETINDIKSADLTKDFQKSEVRFKDGGNINKDAIEKFIAKYNLWGKNSSMRLKFKGDHHRYFPKNIHPDRKHIFVYFEENGHRIVRNKLITDIESINDKLITSKNFMTESKLTSAIISPQMKNGGNFNWEKEAEQGLITKIDWDYFINKYPSIKNTKFAKLAGDEHIWFCWDGDTNKYLGEDIVKAYKSVKVQMNHHDKIMRDLGANNCASIYKSGFFDERLEQYFEFHGLEKEYQSIKRDIALVNNERLSIPEPLKVGNEYILWNSAWTDAKTGKPQEPLVYFKKPFKLTGSEQWLGYGSGVRILFSDGISTTTHIPKSKVREWAENKWILNSDGSEIKFKNAGIMKNGGKYSVKKYLVGGEIGTPEWTEQVIKDANEYFDLMKIEPVGEDYVRYIQSTLKQVCTSNLKTAQDYYKKWLLTKESSMRNGGIFKLGGEISPQKQVKANQSIAISEVIWGYKDNKGIRQFKDLGPMEAGMLYNLRDKEGTKEVSDATGLKEQIYKKLEDKFYIEVDYNDYTFILTDKAKDFIEKVNNRLQTRKSVKAGIDLFPETANIPEIMKEDGGIVSEKDKQVQEYLKEKYPDYIIFKSDSGQSDNIHSTDLKTQFGLIRARHISPSSKGDKPAISWSYEMDIKDWKTMPDVQMENGGTTNILIPVKSVTILWAEGKIDYSESFPKDFPDFLQASKYIKDNIELTELGYDKHKVLAVWNDGEDWEERIDISVKENNPNSYENIFGAYIARTTMFYIGLAERGSDSGYLKENETKKRAKDYVEFITKYDFQIQKYDWQKALSHVADNFSDHGFITEKFKIKPYSKDEFYDVITKWIGKDFINNVIGVKMENGGIADYSEPLPEYNYVTVYDKTKHYGGDEEGGWFYNWYTPLETVEIKKPEEFVPVARKLMDKHEGEQQGELVLRREITYQESKTKKRPIYMQDGGTLHLEGVTHLPYEISVYVPSTKDVDKQITKAEMNERASEVTKFLADKFGGFTSMQTTGGYFDHTHTLVKEPVVKITSFSTEKDFTANKDNLIHKVRDWSKEWGQEAVGLEFEGDLYYVSDSDKKSDGGNTHNIKKAPMLDNYFITGPKPSFYHGRMWFADLDMEIVKRNLTPERLEEFKRHYYLDLTKPEAKKFIEIKMKSMPVLN